MAALAPGLALAADLPTRKTPVAPPVAAPAGDSGFYAGAFVGAEFGGLKTTPGGPGDRKIGFATGTLLGYKWRYAPWTFGVEGDISSNSLRQKFGSRGGFPATEIDSVYSVHARGRVGYQLGNFEPFLAGGFVLSDFAQARQYPEENDGASTRRPGWTVGAGVDATFALPLIGASTIRAEYLYDRFSPTNMNLNGIVYRTSGAEHFARLGLIKYFDAERAPVGAPVVANWNGNYVGVLGGYEAARFKTSADSIDAHGGTIGVYTGRNWMFGHGMLGYEGSTSFGSVNGDGAQPFAPATRIHDYFLSDLRGRAGWAFDRFLPYVAAGAAFDTSSQFDKLTGNYRGDVFQYSATIGAGLEYLVTDRVTLRAEYAYAKSLGTVNTKLNFEDCCKQTREGNSFKLGIGYFLR